jgi:hypothetical protein
MGPYELTGMGYGVTTIFPVVRQAIPDRPMSAKPITLDVTGSRITGGRPSPVQPTARRARPWS